jgi:cyclic pyranopterin phosphate synthase
MVTQMTMKMIDIGDKSVVERTAVARGELNLKPDTITAIQEGKIKKGDVLTAAKLAGIQAVKNTPTIIPLCHPIPITYTNLDLELNEQTSTLTGVSVALLTVWDMTKYLEKDESGQYPTTKIMNIEVIQKIKK